MIITFCGHSKLTMTEKNDIKDQLKSILQKEVKCNKVEFYLGGYGDFDELAKQCCKEFQGTNSDALLYFVTPYESVSYLKTKNAYDYDDCIYPDIQNTPKKYAIVERNKWMIKNSDLVIAYISHNYGGAYKTLEYAKKIGKRCINLIPIIEF